MSKFSEKHPKAKIAFDSAAKTMRRMLPINAIPVGLCGVISLVNGRPSALIGSLVGTVIIDTAIATFDVLEALKSRPATP